MGSGPSPLSPPKESSAPAEPYGIPGASPSSLVAPCRCGQDSHQQPASAGLATLGQERVPGAGREPCVRPPVCSAHRSLGTGMPAWGGGSQPVLALSGRFQSSLFRLSHRLSVGLVFRSETSMGFEPLTGRCCCLWWLPSGAAIGNCWVRGFLGWLC